MADLTVSASGIVAGSNATFDFGVAGASITAGQPVYIDTANSNVIKPAVNTSATACVVAGIALHAAASGQPIKYIKTGDLYMTGTTLPVGSVYVLSATSGGICPVADLEATTGTSYCTIIGGTTVTGSTPTMRLAITVTNSLNP